MPDSPLYTVDRDPLQNVKKQHVDGCIQKHVPFSYGFNLNLFHLLDFEYKIMNFGSRIVIGISLLSYQSQHLAGYIKYSPKLCKSY